LGNRLGLPMPREIRIFAIEVNDPFTLGTDMTPAVMQAVAAAVDRVTAQARELSAAGIM
jgi:hypothetical protein